MRLEPTCILTGLLFLAVAYSVPAGALAQERLKYDSERASAIQLFDEGKFAEALPVLQRLATSNPFDGPVLQHLGFALVATSPLLSDEGARKQRRVEGRKMLQQAVDVGFNVDVLQPIINQMPPDGGTDVSFSISALADEAMKQGEAAFAQGNSEKARAAYLRALQIDPKLYLAAVFVADTYFQKQQWKQTEEWYARAVSIDPDRETAYRYWSDALLRQNKMTESREKAIDAIVAEPYNQISWNGLIQWASENGFAISHPAIESPIAAKRGDGKTDLDVSVATLESKGGATNWLYYELTRRAWTDGAFTKTFPQAKVYRHSLQEETAALRAVAEASAKDLKSGKVKVLEQALAYLVKLNEDGLLESYVLLARTDEGIAQDFSAYRQDNRAKLRRYINEYVIKVGN